MRYGSHNGVIVEKEPFFLHSSWSLHPLVRNAPATPSISTIVTEIDEEAEADEEDSYDDGNVELRATGRTSGCLSADLSNVDIPPTCMASAEARTVPM